MNAERSPGEIVKLVRRHVGLVTALGLTAMIAASGVSLFLTKTYAVETKLEVGAVNNLSGQDYLDRVNAASQQIKSHESRATTPWRRSARS
jgi:capsular polysaccharide biosynthesis protein